MIKFSNLLMFVGVVFTRTKYAAASGSCIACCPGSFFAMVNGNDNQIPFPNNSQLCSGVPVNIWYHPDPGTLPAPSTTVSLTLFGDETLPARCEGRAPYALFGDNPKADFVFRAFSAGFYTIEVICTGCGTFDDHNLHGFQVIDCPNPANA